VRLADDVRRCVVFLGIKKIGTDDELDPIGTGFLVVDADPYSVYLVTARHVIQPLLGDPISVRFNRLEIYGGGARVETYDSINWWFHPTDKTVDVAVAIIDVPPWADSTATPRKPSLLMPDRFSSKNIGPGDLTYTVGIWKFLYGRKRNQPFVHVGHIGLVPEDEKVITENWLSDEPGESKQVHVEAYLVEGEPLDGASGSPVFVRRSIRNNDKLKTWVYGSYWLLGLHHGSWTAQPGRDYQIPTKGFVRVPRGINVVVPSMKINEVIEQEGVMRARKKAEAAKDAEVSAEPSAISTEPESDNPSHKEDFTSLLGRAARAKPKAGRT